MTYNPAIPQASDTISASQPPILTNFYELNNVFGADHVKFDNATQASRGRHLKVTFNDVLGADPGLIAPACSLYTKATGGGNQLFFQNALTIAQLTGLPVTAWANGGSAGGAANYTIDTPWGIRIYCGETASKNSGIFTVTFPAALTAIYYYAATASNTSTPMPSVNCATNGLVGLNIRYSSNATDAVWIAVGKP
jgi:hypothetical protein